MLECTQELLLSWDNKAWAECLKLEGMLTDTLEVLKESISRQNRETTVAMDRGEVKLNMKQP